MTTRRVLLVMMMVLLPVAVLAPMWVLPTPDRAPDNRDSLVAYSNAIRTGETTPAATHANQEGFELMHQGVTWWVLTSDTDCWGQRLDDLTAPPEQLPLVDCQSRD